jgi:hypothetical protein
VNVFNKDAKVQQLLAVLAIVAIVFSLALVFFTDRKPASGLDLKPFQAFGEVMATQVATLVGNNGHIAVVVLDTGGLKSPVLGVQLTAFEQRAKEVGLSIVAVEAVHHDAHGKMEISRVSCEQFVDLARKYSNVNAIVSFVPLPSLAGDDISRLPSNPPDWVVVGMEPGPELRELFQKQIVQMAFVPSLKPPDPTRPKSAQEWFDWYYQVITSASELQ